MVYSAAEIPVISSAEDIFRVLSLLSLDTTHKELQGPVRVYSCCIAETLSVIVVLFGRVP